MKQQSQFIKLPGQRVNSAQIEAGVPNPDTFPAFFWIDRNDIQAVMEAMHDETEEMSESTDSARTAIISTARFPLKR